MIDTTKKAIEDLLTHISPKATVSIESKERGLMCRVSAPYPDLIGPNGDTLRAITHFIRRVVEKAHPGDDSTSIFIDVNGYLEKKIASLKETALILGKRAEDFKRDVEMEPMSSFERFIIHSAFENHPTIKTESKGFGKDRRVVIRYVEVSSPEAFSIQ